MAVVSGALRLPRRWSPRVGLPSSRMASPDQSPFPRVLREEEERRWCVRVSVCTWM